MDVDFEPQLLAPAGLCVFVPVIFTLSVAHPVLREGFPQRLAVKIVDHLAVQEARGYKFIDAGQSERLGEGRVDISE